MKKILALLLMVGSFFILIALGLISWAIRKERAENPTGYIMEDGRENPHPKGSAVAANWARHNPVKEIEKLTVSENGTTEENIESETI